MNQRITLLITLLSFFSVKIDFSRFTNEEKKQRQFFRFSLCQCLCFVSSNLCSICLWQWCSRSENDSFRFYYSWIFGRLDFVNQKSRNDFGYQCKSFVRQRGKRSSLDIIVFFSSFIFIRVHLYIAVLAVEIFSLVSFQNTVKMKRKNVKFFLLQQLLVFLLPLVHRSV